MQTPSMTTTPPVTPPIPAVRSRPARASANDSAHASWHETAWQQVLARDPAGDGKFVYAVRSTAIFCRPTCPSRRPERSRVTFFRSPAEAAAAGYRACLRCRPEGEADARGAADTSLVAAAIRHLEQQGSERVDLRRLSAAVGQPPATILNAFRRTLGTTPARFARERRIDSFRRLLAPAAHAGDTARITDAIYDAGFGSSSRLYERSASALGMTPSALRAGAPGTAIGYTLADSPLGRTLVAATDRGVCAISFADTDEALLGELQSRFPAARLEAVTLTQPASTGFPAGTSSPEETSGKAADPAEWLAAAVGFVLGHLSEHPSAARFPLDVRATAFQQRVWQALQQIPRGATLSYAALARQLGRPTGARAVAGACARNPVALAIPCHRVVSGSGAMAGYRWGVERKRAILAAEGRAQGRQLAASSPRASRGTSRATSQPTARNRV